MRNSIYHFAGRVIFFFISWACSLHSLYAQGFSDAHAARLQQVLERFQNDPDHPFTGGMSAAIKVEGLASWQGATGYASRNVDANNNLLPGGSPFTIHTLSRIYSVTKTFTAALVLELSRQGAFSLDDPVSRFVPLSQINQRLVPNVSIRQLLAHESGYSDFLEEINLQIAVAFQPARSWTPFEAITFANQAAAPGTVRRYSSTNYIILGAIVEAATGKPVEQHFRERFFTPLPLRSMYLAGRESIGNRGTLATPHDNISALNPVFQLTGQPTFPDAYTNISRLPFTAIESISFTSGGIVSNAADVAEWGNALFSGRATSMATRNMMVHSISPTPDEDGDFLGYGIWRSTRISQKDVFIGHDGNATGYRSVMFYQPDKKLTIVVLTNFHGANLYDIARDLYEALPDFTCGQGEEERIAVCWKGKQHCVSRTAASVLTGKGAYLGPCASSFQDKPDGSSESPERKTDKKQQLKEEANGKIHLLNAFPNPFVDRTVISFTTPRPGKVLLDLYDMKGRLVSTLFNGILENGQSKQVILNNKGKMPDGIYLIRLSTPAGNSQKKLVLQR